MQAAGFCEVPSTTYNIMCHNQQPTGMRAVINKQLFWRQLHTNF
jgi:hypothetical protein